MMQWVQEEPVQLVQDIKDNNIIIIPNMVPVVGMVVVGMVVAVIISISRVNNPFTRCLVILIYHLCVNI
jgi:mannose/fructose/N-acetylgalactosamine-specific phosphotransferase system component IID